MMTPSYDKQWWREKNREFFRRTEVLVQGPQTLVQGGLLQGKLLDFAGSDAIPVFSAFKPILKKPSNLLLWERKKENWIKSKRDILNTFGTEDQPRLIYGDAFSTIAEINQRRRTDEPMIGAFNLDLTDQARDQWWTEQGEHFFANCVVPAAKHFGVCAVVLNHTLDVPEPIEGPKVEHFEKHVSGFLRVLGASIGQNIPRTSILPAQSDVGPKITDLKFGAQGHGAWIGKVNIYKSSARRMATIRVYVKPNDFRICSESDLA